MIKHSNTTFPSHLGIQKILYQPKELKEIVMLLSTSEYIKQLKILWKFYGQLIVYSDASLRSADHWATRVTLISS